ncbi:RNA chaperone Hfq, partial [Cardiobacterium hominis]
NISQMVYKHAISTIVPARNVRLPGEDEEGVEGEHPAAPAAETAARPSTDPLY